MIDIEARARCDQCRKPFRFKTVTFATHTYQVGEVRYLRDGGVTIKVCSHRCELDWSSQKIKDREEAAETVLKSVFNA